MNIKLGDLFVVRDLLNEILVPKDEAEIRIPVKTAYWLTKFMNKLQKEIKDYEESRIKLCVKHSEKDENGNPIIKENNYQIGSSETFQEEYNELKNIEIEIPFSQLTLEQFGDINIVLFT
jgi:hypothetical protein